MDTTDKVLIIDDDNSSRLVLKHLMESFGYSVMQSSNGRHGLETLQDNMDVKFIITDIMMPDMDGRELIHLIRHDEEKQHFPVIIISGCFNAEEIQPIIEISPDNTFFMNKPIKREILLEYINKIKLIEPLS